MKYLLISMFSWSLTTKPLPESFEKMTFREDSDLHKLNKVLEKTIINKLLSDARYSRWAHFVGIDISYRKDIRDTTSWAKDLIFNNYWWRYSNIPEQFSQRKHEIDSFRHSRKILNICGETITQKSLVLFFLTR